MFNQNLVEEIYFTFRSAILYKDEKHVQSSWSEDKKLIRGNWRKSGSFYFTRPFVRAGERFHGLTSKCSRWWTRKCTCSRWCNQRDHLNKTKRIGRRRKEQAAREEARTWKRDGSREQSEPEIPWNRTRCFTRGFTSINGALRFVPVLARATYSAPGV